MANNYIYEFQNSLYLNVTNRCPNACEFCIRRVKDGVSGHELWLSREPESEELMKELEGYDLQKYDEVVFCGFGEPMCRLDVVLALSPYLKARGAKVRINTNGLGDLINGEDTAKLLSKCVDSLSISLNAPTAEEYDAICHSKYGLKAFDAMLSFAANAVRYGMDVAMSVVDCIGEEKIAECRKVVEGTGAKFRVRALIRKDTEY